MASRRKYEVVSPSLLSSIKVHRDSRRFSFGLDDYLGPELFVDSDGDEPAAKRRKCLSLKKKSL